MIGHTVSHYRIVEKLGEGGMGVVYKAEDLKLTRTVALKFLPRGLDAHEPERARFLHEARAAAILNHPNVCTVYDIQEHEGQQYIVMEYVDGRTLNELVPVKKLQDAIGYGLQICEALEEAHSRGVVHRDIKTQNIMVNSKNQIKVMDFGLAKLKGSLKLTKATSTVGTLAYMAPEQIQGGEVDARSDIFSFGVVLYELITGRAPFQGEHEAAVIYSILNQEPEPLQHYVPDAPPELLHLLGRALEKDPEDRYQTVHEMLIDLRRLKKDSSRVSRHHPPEEAVPAATATAPEARHRVPRRWIWAGIGGGLVLCAVLAFLLVPGTTSVQLNPHRSFRPLSVPFRAVGYGSVSKHGNWFVFPAQDDSLRWDVYWTSTAGGEPSRITHEKSFRVINSDVSPDADQVAYDRITVANLRFQIRIVPLQGGVSRAIVDTGLAPRWMPDGKRIGFIRAGRLTGNSPAPSGSGRLELWSVKPDGTDCRLELTDSLSRRYAPFSFCWSPDGRSVAWVRNYPEGYGEVVVHDFAAGRERQLTADRRQVDEVTWTSNDNILFISNRSGTSNLWVVPAGGGEAIEVTQGTAPVISARISFDCKKLVYFQDEFIGHIWSSRLEGTNARQITFDDIRVNVAAFSPDGRQVAGVLGSVDVFSPETHLYVMDRDGKNRRPLTSGSLIVSDCRWSLDGKWLAYTSRPAEEPPDSDRVYAIQPSNPGTPRVLGFGSQPVWIDSEQVAVIRGTKSLLYSIKGGPATQVYLDSTAALQLRGTRQMFFHDGRKGREGYWVVAVDSAGRDAGAARRIPPLEEPYFTGPPDFRFRVYQKAGSNEIWRVWLADGRQERVGTVLPGMAYMNDVSMDGRDILWVVTGTRSKLALIENLFD